MTIPAPSSRAHARVSTGLTAAVLILIAASAAAQDTTGVGAISGVVVNAAGQQAEGDQAVSTAQRRGVYDLTRVNAERAPDDARIDIRVDRTFSVSGQPFNVFFGVQNLANRRNFASYSWNRRTNAQQFGGQQGLFPILGFDWRF